MIGSPYGNILPDEITWITNQITNNPTLGFVLVAHYLANDAAVITWQDFISTFFNLLDQHSNVKAVIFGHMHLDHVWYTPGGIPVIATDTDAASRLSEYNPNTATVGTITEHCFDTMTIDLGTNDVYCVRVGRGKNRIVRAGNNTVSSGSTTTLTSILTSPSWSSYDTSVATVSNGVVTGVASGRTYVVAQTDTDAEYWHIVVT